MVGHDKMGEWMAASERVGSGNREWSGGVQNHEMMICRGWGPTRETTFQTPLAVKVGWRGGAKG